MNNITHISLKQLIIGNKYYLSLGLLLLVLNKSATMYIPSTGKYLIDDVIQNKDIDLLKFLILTIFLSLFIQTITSFLLMHVLGIKAQKKIAETRTQFFNKITHLPLSYFKDSSSGEITSRVLNDFDGIKIFLGSGLVQFVGGFISVVLALVLMAITNFKLTLYIVIPIVIFGIVLFFIYKQHKPAFKKRKIIRAHVSANITEAVRNIKIIKGFVSNDYSTYIMKKDFFKLYESIKSTLLSINLVMSLGILFIGFTSILLMWFGSQMVINQELTIGELTTFTMYLGFLIAPIILISRISSQFTDASASIERINETLQLENEREHDNHVNIDLTGSITFDRVSFSYGSTPVLKDVSFIIKPNTTTAFIGKSGSGKTTVTELIAAFYQPESGSILIDGHSIDAINIPHFRRQLGFVFQETYLFNGSIRENILLSNPNATEKELSAALDNANATEFIAELSNGIDTNVGENGNKLSAGQRQRIAITRAFLADPKILILDEITANLDTYNEQLITNSVSKLMENRTIIVIAHRLNTIKNADQIILLDSGKVLEHGTHDELINKQGLYMNLYNN